MSKQEETELSVLHNMLPQIQQELAKVTDKHQKVSDMKTPPSQISKKMGLDYVEIGYMKHVADTEFPGWNWEIIKSEALGSEAYVVHGRLTYYSAGLKRVGDMVAAHRIQKGRESGTFVDVGNDIKSANTDCMKKALNVYLDIAADVYRSEDYELDDKEREDLLKWASKAGMYQEILDNIEEGSLNANNFEGSLAKLRRLAE